MAPGESKTENVFAEKRKAVEEIDNKNSEQFQQFLDDSQYKLNGILRYEKIFGRGFISTGGLTTTKVIYLTDNFLGRF